MTQVDLPSYSPICWQDLTQVDCGYPLIIPRKLVVSSFLPKFPDVASIVKNFAIASDTQEQIMARIEFDNLTLPAAVCEWLKASESTWKSWIVVNGKSTTTIVSSGGGSSSSVNPVPIAIGVSVGGAALITLVIGVMIYQKKGKKRRALKIAPGGVVALVFTDIQVDCLCK